jgi:hypothetical protein
LPYERAGSGVSFDSSSNRMPSLPVRFVLTPSLTRMAYHWLSSALNVRRYAPPGDSEAPNLDFSSSFLRPPS